MQPHLRTPQEISIHSLRMEGDVSAPDCIVVSAISIHSLRMEGDNGFKAVQTVATAFQSTPSAWRETYAKQREKIRENHFNPLPPHGGRLPSASLDTLCRINFNPLPPHGGRLCTPLRKPGTLPQFQSTPSAWRETSAHQSKGTRSKFQSTPSAWRETSLIHAVGNQAFDFNPLPPHGGRHRAITRGASAAYFNPLPPHGGRLTAELERLRYICISIHSLRMEGDVVMRLRVSRPINFNPLPPHGGRQSPDVFISRHDRFQSTPSAWRETDNDISGYFSGMHFNPLPPHGGRRSIRQAFRCACGFQSTPSAWRETLRRNYARILRRYFNPLPPHGGRQIHRRVPFGDNSFQSTPSAWRETRNFFYLIHNVVISIHSLRMEGDE